MGSQYQYTGKAYIRFNGKEHPTLEGGTFTPGGFPKEDVVGSRVYGFKEKVSAPKLSVVIPQGPGVSLFTIKNLVDATIEIECDTGEKFMMANAWCNGEPTLSLNGDINAEFSAIEAKEI